MTPVFTFNFIVGLSTTFSLLWQSFLPAERCICMYLHNNSLSEKCTLMLYFVTSNVPVFLSSGVDFNVWLGWQRFQNSRQVVNLLTYNLIQHFKYNINCTCICFNTHFHSQKLYWQLKVIPWPASHYIKNCYFKSIFYVISYWQKCQ